METPEPEASEEQVDIIIDPTEPGMPKSRVTEEKSNSVANGSLSTVSLSSTVSPASTPARSAAPTRVPTPRSGPNGSLGKGTPDPKSTGENVETISPYINGGIINKRYSYSGSMASESMDLSIPKESISMSARVSQHKAIFSLDGEICGFTFIHKSMICPE